MEKPKILCEKEVYALSSSTNWDSFRVGSIIDDFFYEALVEAGKTATLKATLLSITEVSNMPRKSERSPDDLKI